MTLTTSRAGRAEPAAARPWVDHGFFGPDTPTPTVWSHPTAPLGFQRAVVLERFDPHLTAAAADVAGIDADPHGCFDRTLADVLTVAVADGRIRAQHLRDEWPHPVRTTTPAAATRAVRARA